MFQVDRGLCIRYATKDEITRRPKDRCEKMGSKNLKIVKKEEKIDQKMMRWEGYSAYV
jgi:hypothetical protein